MASTTPPIATTVTAIATTIAVESLPVRGSVVCEASEPDSNR